VLIYAIALLGLNMLTGYNGQISLGHGAFYAIGAYLHGGPDGQVRGAVLADAAGGRRGLPAGRLPVRAAGVAAGRTVSRARDVRAGVSLPGLLKYHRFETWTGGVQGIVIPKPEAPFGLAAEARPVAVLLHARVTLVMFALAWNLLRGRVGRAMVAIRDNHIAAEAMGVNNAIYKSLTFGVSAMYTGSRALERDRDQFVAPGQLRYLPSIKFLVGS
jgi:branched-chain amino acid transport system permease protein